MQDAAEQLEEPTTLVLDQVQSMGAQFLEHIPHLTIALVILLITWVAAKTATFLVGKIMDKAANRRSLKVLAKKAVNLGLWATGLIIAVAVIFPSVTPGKLLTFLGLGGVAVGFAFKDVFENFLAGILILTREPFQLGDFIEAGDFEGWVEEITVRDTRIRKSDGQEVIMPNSSVFKNAVMVRTARPIRRVEITCGVAYDEDVEEARKVILNAVESIDEIEPDKPVEVFACEFGASSVDFKVRWWTGSKPIDIHRSRDAAIEAIKRELDAAKIEIPFPYRTLTFAHPLEVRSEESGEQEAVDEAA